MSPPLPEPITSASNSNVKRVRRVAAGKEPDVLLLEGERLVRDALGAALGFELLLVADDRIELAREFEAAGEFPLVVEASLLDRIGKLKSAGGVLALAPAPRQRVLDGEDGLASLLAKDANALVLVAAGVSDPVNLGALARSAEAAGVAALVHVQGGGVSPWNPRALRGSMGSLLRLPIFVASSAEEAVQSLQGASIRIVRGATRGGANFSTFDWSGPIALWVGGEVGAVDAAVAAFETVSIPMAGAAESLNVTVASSLLLFAAGRAEASLE
jgi:TrmH family RNA methyltransferase